MPDNATVPPATRINLAKFRRELDEDWIDYQAINADAAAYFARWDAERQRLEKRLNAKLRRIGQSLDQLIQAA